MKSKVNNPEQVTNNKICFSYIRFSSKIQAKGDSKRRQLEIAPQVAKEKGWNLKEDLNASDLGVSAFKGNNIKTLEAIIQSAKDGKIPQGAVMIIEAFDRFSRTDLDTAEDLMKRVLRAGIEIYVARGSHHLTRESLNRPIDRIMALLELAAANEYSAKLSERVSKAWAQKRKNAANGVIMTHMAPAWLTVDRDNNKFTINNKLKIVERIFEAYASGQSIKMICRNLNDDNVPAFGKGKQRGRGWCSTSLGRLLSSRTVLGEYQPHQWLGRKREKDGDVIPDYYHRVITNELFYRCQDILARNKSGGKGTKTNATNLFTGLVKCAHCGGSMIVKHSPKGKYYYSLLRCSNAVFNAGCKYKNTIQYKHVERAVLTILWSKVIPHMTEETARADKLIAARGELDNVQKSIERLTNAIASTDTMPKPLVDKITESVARQKELKSEIEELDALSNSNPMADWTPCEPTIDNRMRLQNILRGEIKTLSIDAIGRKATLALTEPAITFQLTWECTRANHIKKNPADSGFHVADISGGALNQYMEYQDELFVWKNPSFPDIRIRVA